METTLKTQIRVILPITLVEELIAEKEERGLGISSLVNRAVTYALKHPEVFRKEMD